MSTILRHAVAVLPWVAVRVHDFTGDNLGMAVVPWPIEAWRRDHRPGIPCPVEIVDVVWAPAGARVAAIVKVRPAVLHPVRKTEVAVTALAPDRSPKHRHGLVPHFRSSRRRDKKKRD